MMRRQIYAVLIILIIFLLTAVEAGSRRNCHLSEAVSQEATKTESLIAEGMPIKVNSVYLTRIGNLFKLKYFVTNVSGDQVTELHWKLFIFNPDNASIRTAEWQDQEDLLPNSTKCFSYNLDSITPDSHLVMTASEAFGESGKWEVSAIKIDEAAKNYVRGQEYALPHALHSSNVQLRDEDKIELYRLALSFIFQNKNILEELLIKDNKNIILSTENIDVKLFSSISGINVLSLSPEEIQAKADLDGEVKYIRFQSFKVEGSSIRIELNYLRSVRAKTIFEPCCGGLVLECTKDLGIWKVKRATSYKL